MITANRNRFILLCTLCAVLVLAGVYGASAQTGNSKNHITVSIVPDRTDWTYQPGDKVEFEVSVVKDNCKIIGVTVDYEWGGDMLKPEKTGRLNIRNNEAALSLKGPDVPGFMTCRGTVTVDGRKYSNYTTVAFSPDRIVSTTQEPEDFEEFWEHVLARNSNIPMKPEMTPQPHLCTSLSDVYHVRFQNMAEGQYIYGMLSVPREKGNYPAILIVPGAGVGARNGRAAWSDNGFVVLEIGIHGIPVNLEPQMYGHFKKTLGSYSIRGIDNRDTYYYRDVYAGCVRSVDFLCSLDMIDTSRVAVCGGSQGGALAIVTAALDPRIKCLFANYPALCQIGGFHYGSTGGWPRIFRNPEEASLETKVKVSEYYDVVNFARRLTVPGHYMWGFNDMVCPPTSVFAAYNEIKAPKTQVLAPECAHWLWPELLESQTEWLFEQLRK